MATGVYKINPNQRIDIKIRNNKITKASVRRITKFLSKLWQMRRDGIKVTGYKEKTLKITIKKEPCQK
jgi:hypothetical protein